MERSAGGTLVLRMIFHAARAGAFRRAAIDYPSAAPTFEAAAALNSAKACRLADQIAMGSVGALPARMPGRLER